MKKIYEAANMEITYLQESDIIVTSTTDTGSGVDEGGDNTTKFGS